MTRFLGLSDIMARRRARRVKIPDSEKKRIIEKQNTRCTYCNSTLHVKTCLIEEVRGEKSEKYSEPLFLELKEWRNKRRTIDKVPAYLIAHDTTLEAIARAKPKDRDSYKAIHNCGEVTWAKYGEEIIAIVGKFKGTEEETDDESFQETSLQAICESCDSSKKQAIRIPEGQMEKITDLGIPVAETVRMAVAEYLRNLEPMPPRNALPSNLEKHLVIRERDSVLVKVIYMD